MSEKIKKGLLLVVLGYLLLAGTAFAQQKYEVKDTHAGLGVACAACHLDKNPPTAPETKACLVCHESYEAVAGRTKALKPNPHESHKGEVPCSDCHSSHGNQKLSCNACHNFTNFKMK
jgi:hypothetical protein